LIENYEEIRQERDEEKEYLPASGTSEKKESQENRQQREKECQQ